jgi:hypothetical protein
MTPSWYVDHVVIFRVSSIKTCCATVGGDAELLMVSWERNNKQYRNQATFFTGWRLSRGPESYVDNSIFSIANRLKISDIRNYKKP